MGFHGGGWWSFLSASSEQPKVTWPLLRRVIEYARPYGWQIIAMLFTILLNTGLTLLTPLILRRLIDQTLPAGDLGQLTWLALGLLAIPVTGGLIAVVQRRLNSAVGEGVIYDLRVALYARLQRMSLRFFTNTRVGELMSRLNSDVVGAQNAISNTIVGILTNIVQAVAVALVMISLEWRLTLISIIVLPLFLLAARRMGTAAARHRPPGNGHQRPDECHDERNAQHQRGAAGQAVRARRASKPSAFASGLAPCATSVSGAACSGAVFFVIIGLISAVGTALIYGIGGYLVIQGAFTVGTIVAFGAYLSSLYGALQGLANAPVEFATSVVSFERVFEVIDLPSEIQEQPDALVLTECGATWSSRMSLFATTRGKLALLSDVRTPWFDG